MARKAIDKKKKPDHGGYREGSGRKGKIIPDEFWKIAENLAFIQCTQDEISSALGIDNNTLNAKIKDRYNLDFSGWKEKFSKDGKASLRRRMWDIAFSNQKDAVKAAIFLCKNYLGMKDKADVTVDQARPFIFCYGLNETEDSSDE